MDFLLVTPQSRPGVALIQLNRPKELNALNGQLVREIRDALVALDADEAVRVVIITGSDRAFAAGADIREMAGQNGGRHVSGRPVCHPGADSQVSQAADWGRVGASRWAAAASWP